MKKDIKRRKLLVHVFGKTKSQLIEEGYHFYDNMIFAPDTRGYIDHDDEWIPCEYNDKECEECRAAA